VGRVPRPYSGDPGIGKSTLLLQAAASMANANRRVVYVTGPRRLPPRSRIRANRLGLAGGGLLCPFRKPPSMLWLEQAEQAKPALLVVDSIQTVYIPEVRKRRRQRYTGARLHDAPDAVGQNERRARFYHRACHQGRRHCRPAYSGAHRGRGFVPGRRAFQRLPAAPLC